MNLTDRVPKPAGDSINTGLSPLHVATVLALFGPPRAELTDEDQPITNPLLKGFMVTASVGPFRVTGNRIAVQALSEILRDVDAARPDLYQALGSDGMICCRRVRGSKSTPSNHAYGFAIDITVSRQHDVRGDGKVLRGLLDLYHYFHQHGWYWGAGFPTEDGMHFEPSDELVMKWALAGSFGKVVQASAQALMKERGH